MKKEKPTYEKLQDVLRQKPPVLQQPELLTNSILDTIHSLPRVEDSRNICLKMTGAISGIAASLLVGFLLLETLFSPVPSDQPALVIPITYEINLPELKNAVSEEIKEKMLFYTLKARYLQKARREDVLGKLIKKEKL